MEDVLLNLINITGKTEIDNVIHARRSVRTFNGEKLNATDAEKLMAFAEKIENPYGIKVDFLYLDADEHGLLSTVITGTKKYIGAKVKRLPHSDEAFGYSFEALVLYAQSLGIGTTWIGGTMNRAAFAKAMKLEEDEYMPCVTPVGYPSTEMSAKEIKMRKNVHSDTRKNFEEIFFDNSFDTPLTEQSASELFPVLEAVRFAPSGENRQSWRFLLKDNTLHFYYKFKCGYCSPLCGDIQKLEIGIAMCHFELSAREHGFCPVMELSEPQISTPEGYIYTASCTLK